MSKDFYEVPQLIGEKSGRFRAIMRNRALQIPMKGIIHNKGNHYFSLSCYVLLLVLISSVKSIGQGYLNLHLKALNETYSTDIVFDVKRSDGADMGTITLNDRPTSVQLKDIGVSQSGRLYAVGNDEVLYYRSSNTASWVKSGITGVTRVDGGVGDEAWVVTINGNLRKYSGSGTTSDLVYSYVQNTNWKATDIAVSYDSDRVFMLRENGRVWRTTNNGTSWTEMNFGTGVNETFKHIDASPAGSVFAASSSKVYQLYDNGTGIYLSSLETRFSVSFWIVC